MQAAWHTGSGGVIFRKIFQVENYIVRCFDRNSQRNHTHPIIMKCSPRRPGIPFYSIRGNSPLIGVIDLSICLGIYCRRRFRRNRSESPSTFFDGMIEH